MQNTTRNGALAVGALLIAGTGGVFAASGSSNHEHHQAAIVRAATTKPVTYVAATSSTGQGTLSFAGTRRTLGAPRPLSHTLARSFAAFRDDHAAARANTPADPVLLTEAATQAKNEASGDKGPQLDLARAIAVPIVGTTTKAWIVPAGDKVCTLVPDPTGDGAGGGCNTPAEVARGAALTVVQPADPSAPAIVVSVVVDGGKPATVTSTDGSSAPLGNTSLLASTNATAGIVPRNAILKSGTITQDLRATPAVP